jgi:N-acetylmuramoyl-L-alanine amidase
VITLLKLTPYAEAILAPSPNHDARTAPAIQGIVLHASADQGNEAGTLSWLRSPTSKVSCHLVVSRTGEVTRLVGDVQRAWHAGLSWWRGVSDVNSITLGIEIANRNDGEAYTEEQYQRVAEIVAHYCRQGLTVDDVVGHADVASERRTDPLGWDWQRFRAGVEELLHPRKAVDAGWSAYDRRSGERLAVDVIPAPPPALEGPPAVPSLPAQVSGPRPSSRTSSRSTRVSPTPACKGPACSRTLWVNGMTVLAAGSVIIGDALDLAFSVGLTLPKEITMWALFGVGMVNILLRLETSVPIGTRK